MAVHPKAEELIEGLSFFRDIDGTPIKEPSWRTVISRVLLHCVDRLTKEDLAVLAHLDCFVSVHRRDLQAEASRFEGRLAKAEGISETNPVAAAFLLRDQHPGCGPGIDLILALLAEFVLSPEVSLERSKHRILSRALRGALGGSSLAVILGGASTIVELHQTMASHLEGEDRGSRPEFEALWTSWLRDKLHSIAWRHASRLRDSISLPFLAPDIDSPSIPVDNSDTTPDDASEVQTAIVLPTIPDEGDRYDVPRACAAALLRASQGDLLAPGDFRVPDPLVANLATRAVEQAERLHVAGRADEAEPMLALALALATGIRESDLRKVRWGDSKSLALLAIDPGMPVLHRLVFQPPNAFRPTPEVEPCLRPGSRTIDWPLPPSIHKLLCAIGGDRFDGDPVFPRLSGSVDAPYRLYELIRAIDPSLGLGSGPFRMGLASRIAGELGSDVAQLAMADSFSMSTGPTYYSAAREADLQGVVANLHSRWFGCSASLSPTDRTFGSRLVVIDEAARKWPADLLRRRRSLSHRKDDVVVAEWAAHRDFLAAALCAVTGHRPTDPIGRIHLDDVIPEYQLITLNDKVVDALHGNRMAATGALWVSELRAYLDRLIDIAANGSLPEQAALARAVLCSERPLFDVPGPEGQPTSFSADLLRASMPEPLSRADNFYRHRLNQCLQHRKADPELRHWQLGWITSPAHATSSMSPTSPRDLAREIGPILDEILTADGWFPPTRRTPEWPWHGVPERPCKDWQSVMQAHAQEHKEKVEAFRKDLREHGKAVELAILPKLTRAINQTIPGLVLDQAQQRLALAPNWVQTKLEISHDICGLILDRVRAQDENRASALEATVARTMLHRLLKASHRAGLTQGALPARTIFRNAAEPSPFLPGLGLAVRHAKQIRVAVMAGARRGRKRELGILALLSVILFSPYRSLAWGKAAVESAANLVRGRKPGDIIRIPAKKNRKSVQIVLSGESAILVARRGMQAPTAHAPTTEQLVAWINENLGSGIQRIDSESDLNQVISTAWAAGLVEVSGPERLLMNGEVELTCVSTDRCLAADDDWPVRTAENVTDEESAVAPPAPQEPATLPHSKQQQASEYARLAALLNPANYRSGKESDSKYGWRRKVGRQLENLLKALPAKSTVALLAGYVMHRLRYGGARVKDLEHKSLQTEVTRFARSLLYVVGHGSLLEMDPHELHVTYLAVMVGKPETSRPLVVESLRTFHRYLEQAHQVPELSFAELAAIAGARVDHADAGLLTDAEKLAVYETLQKDIEAEQARADASPEFIRLASQRLLLFALLEASAARPSSIYGLQLRDVHLLKEGGDFIHIHRTGGYGSAKTDSTLGFIPLDGSLWTRARPWVCEWLAEERKHCDDLTVPLFARERRARVRNDRSELEQRLNDLAKWVSDEPRARNYWLRKSKIIQRHVHAAMQQPARARDVHAVLCASGQATIQTPLTNYISDPVVPHMHSLLEATRATRADLLDATQLKPFRLDVAWQRLQDENPRSRMAATFRQLDVDSSPAPEQRLTQPPALRRHLELLPSHIDMFAQEMQRTGSVDAARKEAGLTLGQVEKLQKLAVELAALRGRVPWKLPTLRSKRFVMKSPRRFPGTENLFAVLKEKPTDSLLALAKTWAATGHAHTVAKNQGSLPFPDLESALAAKTVVDLLCKNLGQSELIERDDIVELRLPKIDFGADHAQGHRSLAKIFDWVMTMVWLCAGLCS